MPDRLLQSSLLRARPSEELVELRNRPSEELDTLDPVAVDVSTNPLGPLEFLADETNIQRRALSQRRPRPRLRAARRARRLREVRAAYDGFPRAEGPLRPRENMNQYSVS